jgi:hypothetical protein
MNARAVKTTNSIAYVCVRMAARAQKLAWLNKTVAALEGIGDTKTMEGSDTGYEWK